jgi:hypothetical protein
VLLRVVVTGPQLDVLHMSTASEITHAGRRSELCVHLMLLTHKIGMESTERDKHILLLKLLK